MKYDAFLSHNEQDKPWVRVFVDFLRSAGLEIFFDEDSIPFGEPVMKAIEYGVEQSKHILLVMSRSSLSSKWVSMESSLAGYLDPDARKRKIIPIILEEVDRDLINPSIRLLNMVDLTIPESREQLIKKLLDEIGARIDADNNSPESLWKMLDNGTTSHRDPVALIENLLALLRNPSDSHLAQYYGLAPVAVPMQEWIDKLNQENQLLVVAIVGEFNAGKSTLINSLLSQEVAFTHHAPATVTLAFYHPGEHVGAQVLDKSGERRTMTLKEYLAICEQPAKASQVRRVDVTVTNAPPIVLLDTPGMGTLDEAHQEIADRAVRTADALVWVIDPNRAVGAQEGAFLRRARAVGLPMTVVISKVDDFTADDLNEAAEWIATTLHYPRDRVILTSAQSHLDGNDDPGIRALLKILEQMSADPQPIRDQSRQAKIQETLSEATLLVNTWNEKIERDSGWIDVERDLIRKQSASVEEHLQEFSRIAVMQQLKSYLLEEIPESLQPEEIKPIVKSALENLDQVMPQIQKQLMDQVHEETTQAWGKEFARRQKDLDRKIKDMLSQPLSQEGQIEYLKQQLTEVAFRKDVIIETIRSTQNLAQVGTVMTGVGAAIAVLFLSTPWGLILGSVVGALGLFLSTGAAGSRQEVLEKTINQFQRERFVDKLCQEFGVNIQARLKVPIRKYLQTIEDEALQNMCRARIEGHTVRQIVVARQEIGRLQKELKNAAFPDGALHSGGSR